MYLTLDVGNTRTKAVVFDENQSIEQADWPSRAFVPLSEWMGNRLFEVCILSSVAAPDLELVDFLKTKTRFFLELDHRTPLPFRNEYATPQTLGKDRVAAVAGAQGLFPEKNILIVDAGTCIKYELLTADGRYLGGNVAPGLHMRLEAMHHFTARLPVPEFELPKLEHGNSTLTALQNGGLRGAILEIEGFVRLFRKKYGTMHLVLSGGDAAWLAKNLRVKPKPVLVPDLVAQGLWRIAKMNKPSA